MAHVERFEYKAIKGLNYAKLEGKEPFPVEICAERFNLIVGPNGGGKTTILEIIRCLSEPSLISYLSRENHICLDSFLFIEVNGGTVTLKVLDNDKGGIHSRCVIQRIRDLDGEYLVDQEHVYFEHGENVNLRSKAENCLGTSVKFIDCLKSPDLDIDRFAEIVCQYRSLFPQICQSLSILKPIYVSNGRLWISFEAEAVYCEDGEVLQGQPNSVPYESVPRGWVAAARLIDFVSKCNDGDIVLIEEPETSLHPVLAKEFIKWLFQFAAEHDLQLFCTSHSPFLVNLFYRQNGGAVFSANTQYVQKWDFTDGLFDDLGVLPSDVFQANGIVWVEGHSDKLYIENWIDQLCRKHCRPRPVVGVDYFIVAYGGAALKNVSFEKGHDASVLKLNKNVFVHIDRDDDFDQIDKFIGNRVYKKNVLDNVVAANGKIWITEGRTIEDYLPKIYQKDNVYKKVGYAEKIINESKVKFDVLAEEDSDLEENIIRLLDAIDSWAHVKNQC